MKKNTFKKMLLLLMVLLLLPLTAFAEGEKIVLESVNHVFIEGDPNTYQNGIAEDRVFATFAHFGIGGFYSTRSYYTEGGYHSSNNQEMEYDDTTTLVFACSGVTVVTFSALNDTDDSSSGYTVWDNPRYKGEVVISHTQISTVGNADCLSGTPPSDKPKPDDSRVINPSGDFENYDGSNLKAVDDGTGFGGEGSGTGGDQDTGDPSSGSGDCSTAICECIEQLKGVNGEIKDAINSNGGALTQIDNSIKNNGVKLDAVKGSVDSLKDQFVTDQDYSSLPSVSKGEEYVPDQPTQAFEDDTTYFQDSGEVSQKPGPLPNAPDAKDWDGVTKEAPVAPEQEQSKQAEQTKEAEQNKEAEKSLDDEMQKETFQQEQPMQPEKIDQQPVLNKEPSLSKDTPMLPDIIQPDIPMNIEQNMPIQEWDIKDSYDVNNIMGRTEFYEQAPPMTIQE